MNENEIEQIRRAHSAARPNPSENPAFANTHHDLGICLRYIEQLEVRTREMPDFEPATRHQIDDRGVDKLSEAMKVKLKQKRKEGRRGWQNKSECTVADLSTMLRDHVEKGDPVDVANFCMMLHYRGERIK